MPFHKRSRAIIYLLITLTACGSLIACAGKAGGQEQQFAQAQYRGRGTVVSVSPSASSVEIDHGEIQGLMPAMTMPFRVKDSALLNGLKPGDQVTFVLEVNSGIELITKIEKVSNL